jgi:hypothetical protein
VQDIRDEQAISEAEAIPIPDLVLPTSPMYEPSSPVHYAQQQQQPMQQGVGIQQPIMMIPQQQQMVMMPQQQQMVMMPQQPQMMMMPQPMMTMQPTQPTSATGAKAAELIEEQLHPPAVTESASVSILDVAPEVKPTSSEQSEQKEKEGTRVIKLS